MNITTLSLIGIALVIVLAVIAMIGIAALLLFRRRRTNKLHTQFGGIEYARAMEEGESRRQAEAGLKERAERVKNLQIRKLASGDRARFVAAWSSVQMRFVDGPGGAVTEADQLLGDVMSTRGYPLSDFEQRAEDISVDHPLVMENYRRAHEIAVRQTHGKANTEDLRQAMIHYRTLFEELVGQPELASAKATS